MNEYMDMLLSEESGFTVTDDQKAMWCVNKIKEAKEEEAKFVTFYQEQIKRIQENTEQTVEHMKGMLLPYFQSVPRKPTKTQESYLLPGAKLVLKKQGPEFQRDPAKLLDYLKKNAPEFIETVTVVTDKAKWGDFKKRTSISGSGVVDTETGEVVDGVTVVERPDVFDVEIGGVV